MRETQPLESISDDSLLVRLTALVRQSQRTDADVVAHIGEVESRRLYEREAASSMYAYCLEVLHLSEHEAYLRIAVARASRKHPELLRLLRDGSLHVSAIARLAPHLDDLSDVRRTEVLGLATHKSKREIKELVAALAPRDDVPMTIRKLPERPERVARGVGSQLGPDRVDPASESAKGIDAAHSSGDDGGSNEVEPRTEDASEFPPTSGGSAPESTSRAPCPDVPPVPPRRPVDAATVEPIAPARYKVSFTAGSSLREKLDRLQELNPGCDLATLLEEAVTEKIARVEARRFGRAKSPRAQVDSSDTSSGSRYIPAAVKRAVVERDGRQCTFVSRDGRRCRSRRFLEFHHDEPFALGGDRSPDNIRLLCRAHNRHLAENTYGKDTMNRFARPPAPTSPGSIEPQPELSGYNSVRTESRSRSQRGIIRHEDTAPSHRRA